MSEDQCEEDGVQEKLFSVVEPKPNQLNNVKDMGAGFGVLCKCHGSYTKSLSLPFAGLFFKIAHGNTNLSMQQVHAAPDTVLTASELTFAGSTANWNRDMKFSNVKCSAAGEQNKLHILAMFTDGSIPVYGDITRVLFKGKSVTNCS